MEASGRERKRSEPKPSSWTARVLAPLALVIVAAAIVLVVGGSLDSSDEEGKNGKRERSGSTSGCRVDAEGAVENGYYVIEPGEDLSVVADRTCIPIDRLTNLNPNLDPQLIQVGSCVDLRTDGCKALAQS